MDYVEIYDLWAEADLKKRIVIAVMSAASAILNEDSGTTNHAERVAWANIALGDPHSMALAFSPFVIMNATVQAWDSSVADAVRDSDVQYIVNSNIPAVAGY